MSLRNHGRNVMATNEIQLFVMLEGAGLDVGSKLDSTKNAVFRTTAEVHVEAVWVSQETEEAIAKSLTPTPVRSLPSPFCA